MGLPYCEKHNVSWAAGKECPDCIADRLQTRVKELEAQLEISIETEGLIQDENTSLRKVVEAAKKQYGKSPALIHALIELEKEKK